ncbi:hypothetical protein E4631_07425 [Hymenobacter sp. UV11]|uniref:hypothetical protein n=1 Tax=Hymenobacter sp. UV11 TaxID=1849735 RepID=UPI001060CB28|nr:hypothetical protein [Hymenobacter sp. UV11]TFZ67788.1 hypothetical protein E4631_07425 [Hymenobacter sp. UV11]
MAGLLAALSGCQEKPPVFTVLPTEKFVGYALSGDTLRVAHLLAQYHRYVLHQAVLIDGRETKQYALPVRVVPPDSVQFVTHDLRAQYQWRPWVEKQSVILFVQVEPSQDNQEETLWNIVAVMNERNSLESDLEKALQQANLGKSVGSDLGPGGMNILFEVTDPVSALPILVRALEARGVEQRARIARRLPTTPNDWRYEVVYPVNFSGKFNSM